MFCDCNNNIDVLDDGKSSQGKVYSYRRISSKKDNTRKKVEIQKPRTSHMIEGSDEFVVMNKPVSTERKDAYGVKISKIKRKLKVTFIDQIDKTKPLVDVIDDTGSKGQKIKRRAQSKDLDTVNCKVCIIM